MNARDWNERVKKYAPPFGAFLQMWEWGEVQSALGAPVKRIFEQTPSGDVVAQGIWQPLPLGASYWFFPKGPLGNASNKAKLSVLKRACSESAFLKVEAEGSIPNGILAAERHPAHTICIALSSDSDEMYARMKPKTRYNIRLAQKKGVEIEYAGVEGLPRFMKLMEQTAHRDGFSPHSSDRYRAILERFQGPSCAAFLAFATYKGKDLAVNMTIDTEDTRTYLHGASANTDREFMAPYALHAALLEDAGKRGIKKYDLWGVAPQGADDHHPWSGITRFKSGFGGERIDMPGTYDVPLRGIFYNIYRLARKVRGVL